MKNRPKFVASALIASYLLFLLIIFLIYRRIFSFSIPDLIVHIAIIAALIAPIALIMIWSRHRALKRLAITLAGLVFTVHIVSLVSQYFARKTMFQSMSFGFAYENWAAITVFMPGLAIAGIILGIFVYALFLSQAVSRLLSVGPSKLLTGLVLLALIGTTLVSYRYANIRRLVQDPVVAMFGFDETITRTDREADLVALEIQARENYTPRSPEPESKPPKNVIVFMADSVNPDHLQMFGYPRTTIPFLDDVKQEYQSSMSGVGRATCTDSVCGVISTLASRYFHDVPLDGAFGLGQVLQEHGYETDFILVGDHRKFSYSYYWKFLDKEANSVFDHYSSDAPINSDDIVLEGLNALPAYDGKPRMIFVFFFSSHAAGEPLEEFRKFGAHLPNWNSYQNGLTESEQQAVSDHYDNKLDQLNFYMSEAYAILKEKGYTESSIFSFLSDHGEEVGARGFVGHWAMALTEGLFRIPFVLASTDDALNAAKTDTPKQLDFAPTITDILNFPKPEIWQGQSMLTQESSYPAFHDFGVKAFWTRDKCFAIVDQMSNGNIGKMIKCIEPSQVRYSFYDLDDDPLEKNNIWAKVENSIGQEWEKVLNSQFDLSDQ